VRQWNADAFHADRVAAALTALGVSVTQENERLQLSAPELAEDGAVVPVQAWCQDDARAIHILVDRNPFVLNASFFFPRGTEPFVSTRIRIAETSSVVALAVMEDRVYLARKDVKVTIGGCGG
jgi:sulfur-oxidizing protein SoxY